MSNAGFRGPPDAHDECWELLPWLANERLGARESAHIAVHLRECAACREELQVQQQLRHAIREHDAVVLAPQTSLHKLMQRIDAAEEAVDELDASKSAAAPRQPRTRPGRVGWLAIAAAVQGIAIAALLSALWLQSREELTAPRFATLTSSQPMPRGAVIRVVFARDVTLHDVNETLRSIGAQIIAGPSEAGVYTLGLSEPQDGAAPGQSSNTRLDAALAQLRADGNVVFSEAAAARAGEQ